jgi:nucleoid-associated protein YgaU
MGLFDFLKKAGKALTGQKDTDAEIRDDILEALKEQVERGQITDLAVTFDDGLVTLSGTVDSLATKQKAVLLAGNIKGVEKVNDDALIVAVPEGGWGAPEAEVEAEPESEFEFYTIQSGDSLSKIAKRYYGDAMKWPDLFEANKEVIKNPDLIYPGQTIRVPKA